MGRLVIVRPAQRLEPVLADLNVHIVSPREVRIDDGTPSGKITKTARDYHLDARLNIDNRRERNRISAITVLSPEQLAALDDIVATVQAKALEALGLELVDEDTLDPEPAAAKPKS